MKRRETLMKLHKGDNVKVLSGNDKGKTGEILEIIPKSEKIIVKGINVRKKHVKAAPNKEGGIIASEFPIHSSIVGLVCPKCGKATRIGYIVEDGKKVRICKKCEAKIN
jgi:large subunit ribosomal protein L24